MELQIIDNVRRNHALEHATIALLKQRLEPETRISGRSTPSGFYLYGNLPTDVVEQSVKDALALLQKGESHLAVSDLCGTNLAVGGILTGLSAMLAVGRGRRLDRVPHGLLAALAAAVLAQPLGRWIQRNVTTEARVGSLALASVECRQRGHLMVHVVKTNNRR